MKAGLTTCDGKRPMLILGCELRAYLQARRNRRTSGPASLGKFYCVRCRAPKAPAGDMADYTPITETFGEPGGHLPGLRTR